MSDRVFVEPLSDTAVRLTCKIKRPPEAVYDAWVDPEKLAKWFMPEPGRVCVVHEYDPRVGGKYSFTAGHCTVSGIFKTLDRPNRIVMTWFYEKPTFEPGETLLTLTFMAESEFTNFTLTHEKMASVESRNNHTDGWSACLSALGDYLESQKS